MKQRLRLATALACVLALGAPPVLADTPDDTLIQAWAIDDIISLDPAEVFEFTRKSGAEVIRLKGGAGRAVGASIAEVVHSADGAGQAAHSVAAAADALAGQSGMLRAEVRQFLADVRAA